MATKKKKSRIGEKRVVSNIKSIQSQKRGAGKSERLELARSRSGEGQETKLKGEDIVSTTTEERREKEITATAQKGLDIEKKKEEIRKSEEIPNEESMQLGDPLLEEPMAEPTTEEAGLEEQPEGSLEPIPVYGQDQIITNADGSQIVIPAGTPIPGGDISGFTQFTTNEQILQAVLLYGSGGQLGKTALAAEKASQAKALINTIQSGFRQQTAVEKSLKVGTQFKPVVGDAARSYATNGKSIVNTARWMFKSQPEISKKTLLGIVAIIGSYPFAGFIVEEATQTLGFATKTFAEAGDAEGVQKAIQEQEELLNPKIWEWLIYSIPYVNAGQSLLKFFKAATVKLEADKSSAEKTKKVLAGEEQSQFDLLREGSKKAG